MRYPRLLSPFLLAAALVPAALAQSGTLDPTFGSGGIASLGIGRPLPVTSESIALRADQGVVVGGDVSGDFAVSAFLADGSPDLAFGERGQVRENIDGPERPFALLGDGRLLLGGSVRPTGTTSSVFALVRLTPAGDRDATFDGDGLALVDFGAGSERVLHLNALPGGGLLATGHFSTTSGPSGIALARILENGSLDTSFGGDGRVTIEGQPAEAVLVDAQGRILVARRAATVGIGAAILRLLPDGSPDTSFGASGTVTITVPSGYLAARGLGELADGRLVLIGHQAVGDGYDGSLARLMPDGSLDPTFGAGGIQPVDFGSRFDGVEAGAVLADGRMLLAGSLFAGGGYDMAIARRLPDGSPDPTFGIAGLLRLDFGDGPDNATAVAPSPEGGLNVLGSASIGGADSEIIARLLASGQPDTAFGEDGFIERIFRRPDAVVSAVLAIPDGSLYVAGTASVEITEDDDFFVARLLADGSFDTAFGEEGFSVIEAGSATDIGRAIALYPDGRVLVAGNGGGSVHRFTAARLLSNGMLDPSFGTGGVVSVTIGSNQVGTGANAVAIQPDGRIVLAGSVPYPTQVSAWEITVVRLMPDGSLDGSFGTGGVATAGWPTYDDRGRGVVLQPEGGIVVAGRMAPAPSTTARPGVMRFAPDGTVDSTFGEGGFAFNWAAIGGYNAITRMDDGRLVAAGWVQRPALLRKDVLVTRLMPDGSPDVSFSEDGVAASDLPEDDEAAGVTVLPDGRVATAGFVQRQGFDAEWVVNVFRPDGTADTEFGTAGRIEIDFEGLSEASNAVAAHGANGVVVAGFAALSAGIDATVIRVLTGPATAGEGGPGAPGSALSVRPNPIRSRAVIRFQLERAGHARVSVVDVLGREVAVLWDGPAEAGETAVALDTASLAPGAYLVRVVAPEVSAALRVTVSR